MGRTEVVENRYDWSDEEPIVGIVETIAEAEGIDPTAVSTELDITLHDHVDTDALETLILGNSPIEVSFTVGEYTVRVGDDTVRVSHG